jgi:magnesium transporter
MIRVWHYNNGKVTDGSFNDIGSSRKFAWVDCYKPNQNEYKIISKKTNIPVSILKVSLNDDLRPRALDVGDYSEFIFASYIPKKDNYGDVVNYSIFTCANMNNLILLRNHQIPALNSLNRLSLDDKKVLFEKGTGYLLYRMCNEVLHDYFEVLEDIEDEIDLVETKVLDGASDSVLSKILKLKKTLIIFHKSLVANREAIANVQKQFVSGIEKKNTRYFADLSSDVNQLIDMVGTYREILASALQIHLAASSNNLNEVAKIISALAAVIMIPTLITGIYGMNFKFMPELNWVYGYPFALFLMCVSSLFLFFVFRKMKWL